MQTLIWAICATLILILIISFLPLGFTKKGKFFVVFCGFILAEAGLVTVTVFPFWETALILLLLLFLSVYFIHARMSSFLYIQSPITLEDTIHNDELSRDEFINEETLMQASSNQFVQNNPLLSNSIPETLINEIETNEQILDGATDHDVRFFEDNLSKISLNEEPWNISETESKQNEIKQKRAENEWLSELELFSLETLAEKEAAESLEEQKEYITIK